MHLVCPLIMMQCCRNVASPGWMRISPRILKPISIADVSQLRQLDLEYLGLSTSFFTDETSFDANVATVLSELGHCSSFECIQHSHERLKNHTKFNLPHFMILGWQKCATTSIYRHLARHPQIAKPFVKEPHFFTSCQFGGPACRVAGGNNTKAYIRDTFQVERVAASGLQLATMDASVDYAQYADSMPALLRKLFPWLRLVFVLRERIGRSMSWKTMMGQKFNKGCPKNNLYKCLKGTMQKINYTTAMGAWLDHFPPEQIHIIQFEQLDDDPEGILYKLKEFLGLNPNQPPAELRNVNQRVGSSGWPLKQKEYLDLVDAARKDGEKLAYMLEKNGLYSRMEWMERWESVWARNLETCQTGPNGVCSISSS